MYQPSKAEMQRYIDEMMRYHNEWTKTVSDAAQKSRAKTQHWNGGEAITATNEADENKVITVVNETDDIEIDDEEIQTQVNEPIAQSPRPDIPYYPTPQQQLGSLTPTVPQIRQQTVDSQQSQTEPQPMEQNRPQEASQPTEQIQGDTQPTEQGEPQQRITQGEEAEAIPNEDETADLNAVFENYQQVFPNIGHIRVQTLTARRTFPVANAIVEISKDFIGGRYLISRQITDLSGKIEAVDVPAVSKDFSKSPNYTHPYTTYTIVVKHPEYTTLTFNDVPVFEGIISWQTVDMIPLSLAKGTDEPTDFEEDEGYSL